MGKGSCRVNVLSGKTLGKGTTESKIGEDYHLVPYSP